MAEATFAAGCFWGVETAFRELPGVKDAVVGYTGGHKESPTYRDVCTDTTGHAEAVRISFDPSEISYETLVRQFFALHDPTQVNRQGPDVGTQYRSAIFAHDAGQTEVASRVKQELAATSSRPIATQVVPEATFWPAEEYHQQYEAKQGRHCSI